MFPIGHQRVGIVTVVPVLDVDGNPVYDEAMVPETTDAVVWVDGCLFEIQTMPTGVGQFEQQDVTTTTSETAFCFMPSVDGNVATVDDDDEPGVMAFTAITSALRLRDFATGRDYAMRGDAVFEVGKLPHVFARCERQTG